MTSFAEAVSAHRRAGAGFRWNSTVSRRNIKASGYGCKLQPLKWPGRVAAVFKPFPSAAPEPARFFERSDSVAADCWATFDRVFRDAVKYEYDRNTRVEFTCSRPDVWAELSEVRRRGFASLVNAARSSVEHTFTAEDGSPLVVTFFPPVVVESPEQERATAEAQQTFIDRLDKATRDCIATVPRSAEGENVRKALRAAVEKLQKLQHWEDEFNRKWHARECSEIDAVRVMVILATEAMAAADEVRLLGACGALQRPDDVDTAPASLLASRKDQTAEPIAATRTRAKGSKKSHGKGGARLKTIAGLTMHHQYSSGKCGCFDAISVNEFASKYDISTGSVSQFLKKAFGDYDGYRSACRQRTTLELKMRAMNGEFSNLKSGGRNPLADQEGSRDEDE